jgi:hypothetical protein
MGHRANLIVVRDGRYDLRYSHWAAKMLPRDLFWGPQHAIAFTQALPSTTETFTVKFRSNVNLELSRSSGKMGRE